MSAAGPMRPARTRKRFSVGGLTFVLYLLAEVFAFIGVGHLIGYGWAFLLLVAVSIAGAYLVRLEGPKAWRRLRGAAETGGRPGPEATTHIARLFGAIMVALPGFVSAVVGGLMFLPPFRAVATKAATSFASNRLLTSSTAGAYFGPRRVKVKVGPTTPTPPAGFGPSDPPDPIEGEIVDR